jgi:hypothetical protein
MKVCNGFNLVVFWHHLKCCCRCQERLPEGSLACWLSKGNLAFSGNNLACSKNFFALLGFFAGAALPVPFRIDLGVDLVVDFLPSPFAFFCGWASTGCPRLLGRLCFEGLEASTHIVDGLVRMFTDELAEDWAVGGSFCLEDCGNALYGIRQLRW